MQDPYGDGAVVKAQEVRRLAKLVKGSVQANRNSAAGAGADGDATSSLDDDLGAMSNSMLAWVEAAAEAEGIGGDAGGDPRIERQIFPPVLLESCCRYMEALATAFPGRFSADCRSLARPVASCALKTMTARGATTATATEAFSSRRQAGGEFSASRGENGFHESSPPPPQATTAGESSGLPLPTATVEDAESDVARDGNDEDRAYGGGGAVNPSSAGVNIVGITIEERKAMELWVDMLGICLLPFCGSGSRGGTSGGSGGKTQTDSSSNSSNKTDAKPHDPGIGDGELADGPFDSDSEEEEDDDDHNEGEGKSRGLDGGEWKSRSDWVAGWMRRAGVTLAEPLECPFDVRPHGRDEDLPCRLAVLIASHAKAAAGASRPSSVSSLTTVLGVLVAFTASSPSPPTASSSPPVAAAATAEERGDGFVAEVSSEGSHSLRQRHDHEAVVEEAFSCLMSLAGATPESSAQAECVKAALVALKECGQAARLSCLEERVPAVLSMLEGVPSRLKLLLARSKNQGQKAYSTARSFCREALAAAVVCARKLIGLAGAAAIAGDPRWFLKTFVVKMASPLLLGDAVGALRAAGAVAAAAASSDAAAAAIVGERNAMASMEGAELCSSERRSDALDGVELAALREVILPGAVERLTKALGSIDRYSAAAAKEVLKAAGWLVKAAGGEIRPHRSRLGMALVDCAVAGKGPSSGGGGVKINEKVRLCLRAVRRLGSATEAPAGEDSSAAGTFARGGSDPSVTPAQSFPEAALDFTSGVVEREWLGKNGDRGERAGSQNDEDDAEESIITLVEAHVTLVALLRSGGMRVPGLPSSNSSDKSSGGGKDGGQEEWPASAKRLAKLAWAIAFRVRKAAGTVEASMALADDDVMLLCQGLEVLEALWDCSGDFFEGRQSRLVFFEGDLAPILATLRGCHDKNSMHPVVFDACSWVQSTT